MNTRTLGTIGMLASPMLFITGMLSGFQTITANRTNGLLGLIFILGWMASALGLRRLRATGTGASSRIVFAIQIFGLFLAGSQQVQEIIYEPPPKHLAYQIADAAWPLSVLFMLVVGALVIRVKTITGWPRFTPLLCGLALPIFIFINAVAGKEAATLTFGIYTMAAWMLFGYTIRIGERARNIERASSLQTA